MYIYAGTGLRNATNLVESNLTASVGAPFRVLTSDSVVIVGQVRSQDIPRVTFKYRVVGKTYPFYEQPFIG